MLKIYLNYGVLNVGYFLLNLIQNNFFPWGLRTCNSISKSIITSAA